MNPEPLRLVHRGWFSSGNVFVWDRSLCLCVLARRQVTRTCRKSFGCRSASAQARTGATRFPARILRGCRAVSFWGAGTGCQRPEARGQISEASNQWSVLSQSTPAAPRGVSPSRRSGAGCATKGALSTRPGLVQVRRLKPPIRTEDHQQPADAPMYRRQRNRRLKTARTVLPSTWVRQERPATVMNSPTALASCWPRRRRGNVSPPPRPARLCSAEDYPAL